MRSWMGFLLLSCSVGLMLTITAAYSAPDTTVQDVDPEVVDALLDGRKANEEASAQTPITVVDPNADPQPQAPADPMQSVVDAGLPAKAKDAAKKLKERGNEVVEVKPVEVAPKRVVEKQGPPVISKEEAEMLKQVEKGLQDPASPVGRDESAKPVATAAAPESKRKAIYAPAPVEKNNLLEGYLLERDSSKIIYKRMSPNDSMNVKMCFSAGLSISFDSDIADELQRVIIDDKMIFDAQEFENHRGVYIRMKRPIPEGKHWESAIRLVRKSDDKTYLINLIGLPCPPTGMSPFPKALYIQDHMGLIQSNNKVLTPEDTIIAASKGLPRIQRNRIRVYDMVASSGSKWAVFGIEVQYPNNLKDTTMPRMVVLDELQVNQVKSKLEYLPVHSKKATEVRGVPTLRFKLSLNIDKNYVLRSRYLHLMFLDEEAGHYQYVRVDTLPYFYSLIRRGFDL